MNGCHIHDNVVAARVQATGAGSSRRAGGRKGLLQPLSMSSREEPASEEERAAIAVLDGFARRVARTRERYVELIARGDRIHREIEAIQAARGVAVLVGGMAVSVPALTRDSAAEQPIFKSSCGMET